MRVGHIDYVNSLPLYDRLLSGYIKHDFEIVSDHPSVLNKLVSLGKLDLSPVSSIEYARHQEEYRLVRPFCINSRGAVYSVLLHSNRPIEQLNGCTIGLTVASATARSICKIILQNSFGFECSYIDVPIVDAGKMQGVDAELIIGDLAFLLKESQSYCYDLAEEWLHHFNQPIVFAVWVISQRFL